MKKKILGVLGGLGPAASARFYSLLTRFTDAKCDQEHINVIMFSIASTPDRTAFIRNKTAKDPSLTLKRYIKMLDDIGVDIVAIPCNTAEYFYDELQKITSVPIIKTSFEAVMFAFNNGAKKLGIMATEGTIKSRIYQNICEKLNLKYEIPSNSSQIILNDMIYKKIKRSISPPISDFLNIADELYLKGCDSIILGCTELSLIPYSNTYKKYNFIDSLIILAIRSVELCGYELSDLAMKYIETKRSGITNENAWITDI